VDLSLERRDTRQRVYNPPTVPGSDSVVPRHTSLHGSFNALSPHDSFSRASGDREPPFLLGRGAQVITGRTTKAEKPFELTTSSDSMDY
jgi:hypothetical protein